MSVSKTASVARLPLSLPASLRPVQIGLALLVAIVITADVLVDRFFSSRNVRSARSTPSSATPVDLCVCANRIYLQSGIHVPSSRNSPIRDGDEDW
ncbi:hypothetical protein ACEWPM_009540 [Roseovarius sp. S4756]|uniref:hypothetical protein n=1 Tax=Roseovarius maritimus TaxID=3342637 RepID=UPI00372636F8